MIQESSATIGSGTLHEAIPVLNFEPIRDDIRAEVLAGLTTAVSYTQKTLPCKLFYDERGSQIFDRICELPEYYPTRTELEIMRDHGEEIAETIGSRALLVEYGSGSSLKTRILLDRLADIAGYVPIDISSTHLKSAAETLAARYSHVPIRPVCADYTRPFLLPSFEDHSPQRTVAYFPGSTIGNFEPSQAVEFLKSIRAACGRRSGLLIGVDLKKDPEILHAAYNDAAGVTAAFNLNLLRRINREIGSNFQINQFAHYAFYNPQHSRMEMHLVSRRRQRVDLGHNASVDFADGESIHTESCHKFTVDSFTALATDAGYRPAAVWTDKRKYFSVHYLHAAD